MLPLKYFLNNDKHAQQVKQVLHDSTSSSEQSRAVVDAILVGGQQQQRRQRRRGHFSALLTLTW